VIKVNHRHAIGLDWMISRAPFQSLQFSDSATNTTRADSSSVLPSFYKLSSLLLELVAGEAEEETMLYVWIETKESKPNLLSCYRGDKR